MDRAECARTFRETMAALTDGGRRRQWEVYQDFTALAYCAIAKLTARGDRAEELEARYMETVGRYTPEQAGDFSRMLGMAAIAIGRESADFLGDIYEQEGFCDQKFGAQFFTPWVLCEAMARMTLGEPPAEPEVLTLCEPCCGSGRMVLASAEVFRESGRDPRTGLWVDATDLDPVCARTAYIQFALAGIPAVVRRGNTLSLEMTESAMTPAGLELLGESAYLRARLGVEEAPVAPDMPALPPPPPEPAGEPGQAAFDF